MTDNVWTRISNKRPKGKKLFLYLGIFSGIIWTLSIAMIFLLKDKGVKKALTEVAGTKSDTLDVHALKKVTPHHGEANHGAGSAPAHDEEDPSKQAEQADKAEFTVDMPTRVEWEALKQLMELHVSLGELEKAVIPLERVLALPTRDADLLTLATRVFLGTGRYAEALQMADQALVLRPTDIPLRVQAIEATYRMGQVEKAFKQALVAVKQYPTNLSVLLQLGTMEVELGPMHPDYGKSLLTALHLDPENQQALYLMGRKCQLEGNYKDAENTFRKILKDHPRDMKIHGQLGISLYHQGQSAEAEKEYRAELAINPRDYNTWFNLGELHLSNASLEFDPAKIQPLRAEAMDCFLRAIELNGQHAQAQYRVGVLLNGNGQYKEAIRHLVVANRIDARHVPTLVQLALSYENLKLPEQAKDYLTKAYELDPLNKVVLFKLKEWS